MEFSPKKDKIVSKRICGPGATEHFSVLVKMAKKREDRAKHSSISDHKRIGTQLIPMLGTYEGTLDLINWQRDLLPEHLWVAALVRDHGNNAHKPFNLVLGALDAVWPHRDSLPIGFITDFGEIPDAVRQAFVQNNRDLIFGAILKPIGYALSFYPENPANWLLENDLLMNVGSLDEEAELSKLREIVEQLLPGTDEIAGRIRVLPATRLMNAGKVELRDETPEAMSRYPLDCTDDERVHVEAMCRMIINVYRRTVSHYQSKTWPKSFWRHNYKLVPCKPASHALRGSRPLTENEVPSVIEALELNAEAAKSYLLLLRDNVVCDLYAPEKDEILFGLISRAIRLFVLMMENTALWARDTSGIILRCLAETRITFVYLVKCGTEKDFELFRAYGEGQEKLLMLHLQDSYMDDTSLEGRTSDAISDELGGFRPELINIELGSWSKKDARKLAKAAGMEKLYRLVFSPTSADVHGSWLSLKQSNLVYCAEPLHRFHRLPTYVDPPLYVHVMLLAQALVQECIQLGIDFLKYPPLKGEFPTIPGAPAIKEERPGKS